MRKSEISLIAAVAIGGLIIILTALLAHPAHPVEARKMVLPSPTDIQLLLNELDPNDPVHVDGIIGEKTLKKWDKVYCNESARVYFKP